MAVPKRARLVAARACGAARVLSFEPIEPGELSFAGGQYLIVDSGLSLPSGKAAKRAYSILSPDATGRTFQLAAKRIATDPGGGLVSAFLHELPVGAELAFSGPWGKMHPGVLAPGEPTWVVATDTGITAALGLVRGRGFSAALPHTELLWLAPAGDFLPDDEVRAALPEGLARFRWCELAPVGDPGRIAQATAAIAGPPPATAYLAGDGVVLAALQAAWPAAQLAVEPFFNAPKKAG